MGNLGMLGPIIDAKQAELAARLGDTPIAELRANAEPTTRSLKTALERPGGRFIFEFKRASPSEGELSRNADPADIARAYTGVADAMSVLVDQNFRGSYADLRAARTSFLGPILAKDFVVDPRQVPEARIHGADAVLVILAVLDNAAAQSVMAEAARLAMDVLVEVHDEAEMHRALALGAPLIGINNRDLKSFRTDLSTTERLAPLAEGRTVISESGIVSRADIERLSPLVDGFLIGSTPMRDPDPRGTARALVFGRVKLCGLRSSDDLIAAAPAAYAGLVFAPDSPRALTTSQAKTLATETSGQPVPPLVGVFQNAPLDYVVEAARRVGFAAIQLHGSEDAAYVAALRDMFDGEIWLAENAKGGRRDGGNRILYDNGKGGTGATFDWASIVGRKEIANGLIAGGIGTHNAREALSLGAFAIDVGSATDAVPGTKDHAKFTALFDSLRPMSRKEGTQGCA